MPSSTKPGRDLGAANLDRPGSNTSQSVARDPEADKTPIDRVLERLPNPQPIKPGVWKDFCPTHADRRKPNLQITETPDKALIKCWAGCATADVIEALGLKWSDLFRSKTCTRSAPPTVTRYHYTADDGRPIATKKRLDFPNGGKATPWCRPNGDDGLGGLRVADLPLYGLPDLLAADSEESVIFPEGEKAREAAKRLGFLSVTNAGGAEQRDFGRSLEPLRGRTVFLWPDNDAPGRDLVDRLAALLEPIAAAVYRLDVPGLPEKGDAFDFEEQGRTASELRDLMAAAPLYRDYTIAWMHKRLADQADKLKRLDELDERVTVAEGRLDRIQSIVADDSLQAGEKIVKIALGFEGAPRQARAGDGAFFKFPLICMSEKTGISSQTVSKTLKKFATTGRMAVDVKPNRETRRDETWAVLPGTTPEEIWDALDGSKMERFGKKWGGPGNRYCPKCEQETGTVTETTVKIRCANCDHVHETTSRVSQVPLEAVDPPFQDGIDPANPAEDLSSDVLGPESWSGSDPDSKMESTDQPDADDSLSFFGRLSEDDDLDEEAELSPFVEGQVRDILDQEDHDGAVTPADRVLLYGQRLGWAWTPLAPPHVIPSGEPAWRRWVADPENATVLDVAEEFLAKRLGVQP